MSLLSSCPSLENGVKLTPSRFLDDPSSLDAALIRPGRIDEIIELKYATKQQAEDLFNTFYKPYDEESPAYNLKEVASWAKKFSSCISDGEFSPASLQTFLLQYRLDPAGAVTAFPEWTRKQREDKAFTSLAHTPVVKEPTKLEGAEGEKGKENQSCQCGCIANDDE